jgi:hypothetical protein
MGIFDPLSPTVARTLSLPHASSRETPCEITLAGLP